MKTLRRAHSPIALALALATTLLGAAPPVHAQAGNPQSIAAASALFTEATNLMKAQRYAEAVPKLEEVLRIDPSLTGAKFNLALCHEQLGRLVTAWSAWMDVEAASRDPGNEDRRKTAAERMAELKPRLSTLAIDVPEPLRRIPGIQMTRDTMDIGSAQWGVAVPVDGGKHTVTVTAPGKDPWQKTVDVPREGGRIVVEVGPMKDQGPPAWRDMWTLIGTGAGLALVGVSIPFWIQTERRIAAQNEHCRVQTGELRCESEFWKGNNRKEMEANYGAFIGLLSAGGTALAAVGIRIAVVSAAGAPGRPNAPVAVLPWLSASEAGLSMMGSF